MWCASAAASEELSQNHRRSFCSAPLMQSPQETLPFRPEMTYGPAWGNPLLPPVSARPLPAKLGPSRYSHGRLWLQERTPPCVNQTQHIYISAHRTCSRPGNRSSRRSANNLSCDLQYRCTKPCSCARTPCSGGICPRRSPAGTPRNATGSSASCRRGRRLILRRSLRW